MRKPSRRLPVNDPPNWFGPLVDYAQLRDDPQRRDPTLPPADPAETRRAMRRVATRANQAERATLAFPPLKCRGRCGRRIAKVLTDPRPGETTPDGTIESSRGITGPELSIFGPADVEGDEVHLRRKESPSAPETHFGLRGRTRPIVIVCNCGFRNVLDPLVLTEAAEARRV